MTVLGTRKFDAIDDKVLTHNSRPLKRPRISSAPTLEQIEQSATSSFIASPMHDVGVQLTIAQRDQARLRAEEQKKLFAARNLNLVLDLDHTLLQPIMFAKLDPMHEAILRKEDEIDREMPKRHLFRLAQLGLCTKLKAQNLELLRQG